MSVPDGGGGRPSEWAIERFGQQAGRLTVAIPEQLGRAQALAHSLHLKAAFKKRSPYGFTLAQAVRENLADMARELGGMCVRCVGSSTQ